MLKAKTVSQQIALLSGNKRVYEFVYKLAKDDGCLKCQMPDDEGIDIKNDKVLVTITKNTMTAMNVYGTIFEDLTKKDCRLYVLKEKQKRVKEKKKNDKANW